MEQQLPTIAIWAILVIALLILLLLAIYAMYSLYLLRSLRVLVAGKARGADTQSVDSLEQVVSTEHLPQPSTIEDMTNTVRLPPSSTTTNSIYANQPGAVATMSAGSPPAVVNTANVATSADADYDDIGNITFNTTQVTNAQRSPSPNDELPQQGLAPHSIKPASKNKPPQHPAQVTVQPTNKQAPPPKFLPAPARLQQTAARPAVPPPANRPQFVPRPQQQQQPKQINR